MIKISTGSTISYGAVLPANPGTADGSLFFLTSGYIDPALSPSNPTVLPIVRQAGLHVYNFQNDTNLAVPGDQVGQIWRQLSSLATYVLTTGDTMTGDLFTNSNIVMTAAGAQLQNTAGQLVISASHATGNISLRTNGVERMNISSGGAVTIAGNVVWHAGNDGAGSGLDADFLDGLSSASFIRTDFSNWVGTLTVARGGTNASTVTAGGVVFGASASAYGSTAVGTAGQLLQSGGVGTPIWVNQSTIAAGSAVTATTTTNLSGGAAGSLPYQSAASTTAMLAAGTSSMVLVSGGTPSWTNTPTLTGTNITGTAAGLTAGLATTASNVTIANDTTTNATMFPTWVTATGASLPVKVTSTKLTFNPSTGVLAATTFSGSGASLNSIPNGALTNSSITIGSTNIALGATSTSVAGLTGVTLSSGVISNANGSAAAPSYTFGTDTDKGMYGPAVGTLAFAIGGLLRFSITNTQSNLFTNLDVVGNIIATGDITAFSDARLKTNIETITNPLQKVQALRGVSYNRLDLGTSEKSIGVIAQEVLEVLPEVVRTNEDGMHSVAYGNIVGLLIEAIKEQQKQIAALQASVSAMRG